MPLVSAASEGRRQYNLQQTIKIRAADAGTSDDLYGQVCIYGYGWPDSKKPDRLKVEFKSGELRPAPDQDLKVWNSVFKSETASKQTIRQGLGKKIKNAMLGLFMGLVPPSGTDAQGVQSYTMSRSPTGYLDYLYQDESLRITQGNAKAIVVVKRV